MKTLKLAILGAVACMLTIAATAQTTNTNANQGDQRQHKRGALESRLADQLNLTADQRVKWDALYKDFAAQAKVIRDDSSLTQDQRKEKMQALQKSLQPKLDAFLTPDQQAQLKELRKNARGPSGRGPGGPPSN